MELINGNEIAQNIIEELTLQVAKIDGVKPCVVFIRVGEDPLPFLMSEKKKKLQLPIGINSRLKVLPVNISQEQLLLEVEKENLDPTVHGILVQAPSPPH
jgi:methylenetetrahydrofolate dehydrogenase (NADP+)/methenyltetrahydrofolate cyclohydrolase